MTPTPEQVAQWARDASESTPTWFIGGADWKLKICTLAYTAGRVAQAEQDAACCEALQYADKNTPENLAAAIRANAPKGDV